MSSSTNWAELVKDRKGIRTKDNKSCGNIIGNDEKNIIMRMVACDNVFTGFQVNYIPLQWC
jgi:hypothetical protein